MSDEEKDKQYRQEMSQIAVKICRGIDMSVLQLLIASHQQDKTKDADMNKDNGK